MADISFFIIERFKAKGDMLEDQMDTLKSW